MSSSATRVGSTEKSRSVLFALLLVTLAVLPSAGTLGAPWISEDASILGRMAREGALSDLTGPQYGMRIVRFFRPVVSLSWWFQEACFGTWVVPARLFNLGAHALVALLVASVVRRLGYSGRSAVVAGAVVALFPELGGTVTWVAGRTDVLGALLMAATLVACFGARSAWWSALFAFAACATKEFAFVLPVWCAALLFARRGVHGGAALRRPDANAIRSFAAVTSGVVLGFVARRLALGTWIGGYAGADTALRVGGLLEAGRALGSAVGPTLLAVAILALLGAVAGTLAPRLLVAGIVSGFAALAPLIPLAADGTIEPANMRLVFTAHVGFAFAAASSIAYRSSSSSARRRAAGAARASTLVLAALWLGSRGVAASRDAREWAAAAERGEAFVEQARALVASDSSGRPEPALVGGAPRTVGGAYALHWGIADRFRPPFDSAQRPVWPLRPLFGRESSARFAGDGTWLLCPGEEAATFDVRVGTPVEGPTVALDERVFLGGVDESPVLVFDPGVPPTAPLYLEAIAFTELGYEPALLGPWPTGPEAEVSLRTLMSAAGDAATLGQALMQAADVGARRAYVQLRAVRADGSVAREGTWVELTWDDALTERALTALGG